MKCAKRAREYERTITKPERDRLPWPIGIDPNAPPIHLGLFGRQDHESAIQRDRGLRADHVDQAPKLVRRTGVAARPHHFVEAGGAQPGIQRQRVANEGQIRVHDRGATQAPSDRTGIQRNRRAHGVRMDAEIRDDGADLPMLAEIQSADLGVLLGCDHEMPLSVCDVRARSRAQPSDSRGHRHSSTACRGTAAARPVCRAAHP